MNFTANIWRATLLSSALTLAAGCVLTQSQASDETPSAEGTVAEAAITPEIEKVGLDGTTAADASTDQTAQILGAPIADGSSRILVPTAANSVGIEVIDGKAANQVVIGANLKEGDYSVKRFHSPERIVVDLFSQGSKLNRSFDTQDSEYISKVRVGAHPDKSRVVLDLAGDAKSLTHQTALRDGSLVLTVASAEAAAENITQQASTMVAPSAVVEADTTVIAKQGAADTNARLSSLQIASAPRGGNMVVAEVSPTAMYGLKKTAASEYVLTIKRASLNPEAALTLLAPASEGAIRSVRPVVDGDDVLLRVFTAPDTTLSAKADGDRILLGAFPTLEASADLKAEEVMAQLSPDAEKSKVEDAKPAEIPVVKEAAKESVTAKDASKEAKPSEDKFASLLDDSQKYSGRLISLDLQDTDIDNALRIIAEVSNLNIIASEDVTGKITLRLIDVPWDQALDVILKTNGLDKVQEGNVVRIAPVEKLRQEREALKQAIVAEQELEPLGVEYVRVSYAKAAELKPLVESVLTERGSVVYDERTNQLIIKDIKTGIKNVTKLVGKLDLRTPQILLETQIVEASRSLLRDLGSEFDFDFRMTPATGNPTGYNFPNSVVVGGGGTNVGGNASSFPAAIGTEGGSAIGIVLGSADGTKRISAILSALENEGRVRVVSRPSVATTNNKQATIKSVEKIRIKLPSGGLSVATGANASNSGNGSTATEVVEIGITLEVTPQASPDYYVLLDINAKSSTLGTVQVDGIPSEIERMATSTVLVSSGQTFAMGGIYKISDNDSVRGVPFLKDIPVLGTLFRRSRVDNRDEELLFFLTPRIIEGSFDDAAMRAASAP